MIGTTVGALARSKTAKVLHGQLSKPRTRDADCAMQKKARAVGTFSPLARRRAVCLAESFTMNDSMYDGAL